MRTQWLLAVRPICGRRTTANTYHTTAARARARAMRNIYESPVRQFSHAFGPDKRRISDWTQSWRSGLGGMYERVYVGKKAGTLPTYLHTYYKLCKKSRVHFYLEKRASRGPSARQ